MKSISALNQRTKRIGAACLLTASAVFTAGLIPVLGSNPSENGESALLSPGLQVLAQEYSMAMAGLKGSEISFAASDFARAVNRSEVDSVVITSVPPVTDGELRVGTLVLTDGQTVSGSNLSHLTYTAKSDVCTSSFRFQVEDNPTEITCNLYLLDGYNSAPALTVSTSASLPLTTYQGTPLFGMLTCTDPEGDDTRIEIVSYPTSGSLLLTDAAEGRYTYLPVSGAVGKDSFTYVARDRYGNYSAAATVELEILRPGTSAVYADLEDSPYANAALAVTEAGLMGGTQVGETLYFQPDGEVSRAEFTKLAMCALGMTQVSYRETAFADNASIPSEYRGYVAAACELGYVKGSLRSDGAFVFEPMRAVTRSEAAVILGRMMELSAPTVTPVFDDSSEIPAWAASAIYSLHSAGILSPDGGQMEPLAQLTRGDMAVMLSRILSIS